MALSISSYKGIVNKNLDVYFFMNIRICKFRYKKVNGIVLDEMNIQKRSINQKSNNMMPVMLCKGAIFVKKVLPSC